MTTSVLFICLAGFLAAAIDAIAGGGGIISLPALLATGIPPHFALGTNKFASTCGSLTSSFRFARSKMVHFPLVKYQVPCTALGAALGVYTALRVDEGFLNWFIVVMIFAVAVYTTFKKDFGGSDKFTGLNTRNFLIGMSFAFGLGFYDGFFGPGAGSFLIFLFISVFGFDFTLAAGNSKVLNFTSNVVSLILFAISGKIIYMVAIPMALSMVLGAYVGSHIAIKNGAKIIKPIFITIALLLIIKLIWQAL